ncbi:MAG: T9SS type A sorting domain-containing protein [Ignavibacteria bacterium]|nr:T9SS type A sorting domain-containing protein [Ignavibacteria bacterium]MCU7502895.1 T9SS type A sorting domain-containing protein [Ignavibacteria bacterium]MCU7515611.1 T9SS type A sorting domain-containing protein [Ignavibacteria bacterium]
MKKALLCLLLCAFVLPEVFPATGFAQVSRTPGSAGTTPEFEVDSLAPGSGPTTGGTAVKIFGKKFLPNSAYEVNFGGIPGSNVTRIDNRTLSVISPRHPFDTAEVSVVDKTENPYVIKIAPDSFRFFRVGTKLSVLPASAYYNGSVELSATLTDSSDLPIDSQSVTFTLNGIPAGTALTDKNGLAKLSVNLNGVSIGLHPGYIGAGFAATPYYNYSMAEPKDLTVNPSSTSLVVKDAIGTYGGTVTLEATLTFAGAPLQDKMVKFTFNNSTYQAQTNPGGLAQVNGVGIAGFETGTHPGVIMAEFAAADGYEYSSGSAGLTIEQAQAVISVDNLQADYGATLTLKAVLSSTPGFLKGETISFTIDGISPQNNIAITDDNGVASIAGIDPILLGIGAGSHTIAAGFAGNTNYKAASASGSLTLKQALTNLSLENVEAGYGSTIMLKAKLVSSVTGLGIKGVQIGFSIEGGPAIEAATTNESGEASKSVELGTTVAGSHNILASFQGNNNYAQSQASAVLNVKLEQIPTTITFNKATGDYGGKVTLSAKLTTSQGLPLSNMTLHFKLNGIDKGDALTNAQGVAELPEVGVSGIDAGMHENYVEVSFSPQTSIYAPSAVKGNLEIMPAATKIEVTNVESIYRGTVTLSAKLTSKVTGLAIQGETVNFSFSGAGPTGSGLTDENGIATVSGVSVPGNLGPGLHSGAIWASFPGSHNYKLSTGAGDLSIKKTSSQITVLSAAGFYGAMVSLSANLKSGNSNLSGQVIKFYLNDIFSGEGTTGSDGVASINASLGSINAGVYPSGLRAQYDGSETYASASASNSLTVERAPTSISVEDEEPENIGDVTLKARLTSGTKPLQGELVSFTIDEKSPVLNTAMTDENGLASLKGIDLSLLGITSGTHVIKAAFAPSSGNYSGSSGTGTLKIHSNGTSLTVNSPSAPYGGSVMLRATLSSSGKAISGKTVYFTVNSVDAGSATTNVDGLVTKEFNLSGLNAGNYPIKAIFNPIEGYGYSEAAGTLTVTQAVSRIAVNKSTGTYGGKVTLSAKLTTLQDEPLSNATLHFRLNNEDIGNAATDASGVARIAEVALPLTINAGTYNDYIEAGFSPQGGNYAPSAAKGQLEVMPLATSLSVDNADAGYGSTVTLTARLTIPGGTGLGSKTIVFKIDGNEVGSGITASDGKAIVNYSLGSTTSGEHVISAFFSPAAPGNYSSSTGTAKLTVRNQATSLSVNSPTGIFGGSLTLTAVLKNSSGAGLDGMRVNFFVNGIAAGTAKTASGGMANLLFSLAGLNAGIYPIKAEFNGEGGYGYSSATGDLKVQPAITFIAVTSVSGTYGGNADLSAALSSLGAPLSGRTLSFKLNGKEVGSALTGSNGIAILQGVSLSGIDAGFYSNIIVASFAASGNYNSSVGSGNLTIKQAATKITVSKAFGTYNGYVSLSATLNAASSGLALSGRTVYFRFNGVDKGSALTDNNGVATLSGVSIAGLAAGMYYDYIEAAFSPSGGNYAPSNAKGHLEIGPAATSIALDKVTSVYGSKVTLSARLTSQGVPLGGRTIEFMLGNVFLGTALTDINGLATRQEVDLSGTNAGLYPGFISASFSGTDLYKACSSKADLEIKKAASAVTVLPVRVQYSDQVTLTAIVTSPAQVNLNSSGGRIELKYQLGSEPEKFLASVTYYSVINGRLNFLYTFTCTLAPCSYKILALFIPSDNVNFDGSCSQSPWGPLTVEKENALSEYRGSRYFLTPALTPYNASLSFSATLTDMPDAFRGDISKAKVEFKEVQSDGLFEEGISRGKDLPVLLTNPSDQTVGTAAGPVFNRDLSQGEINNEGTTFQLYTLPDGYYCGLSDPVLITVCLPGKDNISGGGFIVPNSSSGVYRSQTGSKADFGFTMKYTQSGSSSSGQANMVIRGENNKIYLIKSSLISTVAAYLIPDMPGKAASFSAKASLTDITDPRKPVLLAGDLWLTVEMYDEGKDRQKDAVAITLKDANSVLLYSSNWDGTRTFSQALSEPLGSGNIRVLSTEGSVSVEGGKAIPKEYALSQNYPNPFNPSTNIEFELPEESRVDIVIYNILGKEVARLADKEFPAGRHQAVWNTQNNGTTVSSGMYILRLTAKSLTSQRSLISTKKMMLLK